ncbi:penicillin-binding protein 1C [Cellvibrio sp. pealriver]|uniref:penicillin-binding protein 1C n=1 Tax=Cellvibrio sp. pealriver TaxID=1622269 RepID=UPI00066FEAE5|nr:penicillin-binding protein 1C [Cellvibrio sp. pealriver]
MNGWRWILAKGHRHPFISSAVIFLLFIVACLQWLPLPSSLTHAAYARMLLARDGSLLGASIAQDQQWRFAPAEYLPEKYKKSLLLFEDQYFYSHPGINPLSIMRAAGGNFSAGKVTSGGSTLTMQLARLLRQGDAQQQNKKMPARNVASKLVEAFIALQLEWRFNKDELLIHYASHAPFGGNIVGLRAAAWRYFGRAPENLSWAESALLAVLPNSPALIHPGRQRDLLQQKRDRLLKRMHAKQYFSDLDLQLALLEPLPERPQQLPQLAPHLLATLKKQYPDEWILHSSIDPFIQRTVQQITSRHSARLANEGVNNIALVLIDHERMETLAYIGNESWQQQERYAPRVDIVQRPRSTGSILKPLLYGLMLQEGQLTPTRLVPDIPTQFGGYSPKNYDRSFRGAVPAQFALAHSLNVPAVRMLRDYGIGKFQQKLQAMGMSTLFRPADDYGLTLILGGAEGTLWELTGIYARLAASARDGDIKQHAPLLLLNQKTNPIKSAPIKPVLTQGAAWLTLQALIDVARPGNDNYWRDFSGSQTIAWKTGTSYGLRDAWAIGSNGRYTLGVWVGNADGEAASFISGQSSAAPILFDVFDALPTINWFAKPAHALKTISVCSDDGYLAGGQCAAVDSEIPRTSHFDQVTPFHRRIHLDGDEQFRVHGRCETVSNMKARDWFVLPPVQEFYWRQYHSEYTSLPPWRSDCVNNLLQTDEDQPIEFVYPNEESRIYIPMDLDGKRSRIILKAIHRNPAAQLYWHLNDEFLGATKVFHEREVALEPGIHTLLVIDKQGYRLERRFRVISQ